MGYHTPASEYERSTCSHAGEAGHNDCGPKTLQEQARAEAEKRTRAPGISGQTLPSMEQFAEREGYRRGFVQGAEWAANKREQHRQDCIDAMDEAATRTRVVTTEQVAAVIGDALRDWTQGCNRRSHRDGDGQMGVAYAAAERVMALYEPEEDR